MQYQERALQWPDMFILQPAQLVLTLSISIQPMFGTDAASFMIRIGIYYSGYIIIDGSEFLIPHHLISFACTCFELLLLNQGDSLDLERKIYKKTS